MCNLWQTFMVIILYCSLVFAFEECNVTNLKKAECPINQTCIANSTNSEIGYCDCRVGFQRANTSLCVKKESNANTQQPSTSSLVHDSSSSHLAAAIVVPIFIISLVIIGAYIGYRYKLITWVRIKINQSKSNYDEVMIGQDMDDDDPPLR